MGPPDTEVPLTGDHGQCKHDKDPADIPRFHADATFTCVYPLDLYLFRWRVLEIENVLRESVKLRRRHRLSHLKAIDTWRQHINDVAHEDKVRARGTAVNRVTATAGARVSPFLAPAGHEPRVV